MLLHKKENKILNVLIVLILIVILQGGFVDGQFEDLGITDSTTGGTSSGQKIESDDKISRVNGVYIFNKDGGKLTSGSNVYTGIQSAEGSKKAEIKFDKNGVVQSADFNVDDSNKEGQRYVFGDVDYYAPPKSRVVVNKLKDGSLKVDISIPKDNVFDLDKHFPKSVKEKSGVKSEVTYFNEKGFSVSKDDKELPVKFKSLSFKEYGDKCENCPDSEKFLTYTKDSIYGVGIKVSENKINSKGENQRTYVGFNGEIPNMPEEKGGGYVSFGDKKFVTGSTNGEYGPITTFDEGNEYVPIKKGERLAVQPGPGSSIEVINRKSEDKGILVNSYGQNRIDVGKNGIYVKEGQEDAMVSKDGSVLGNPNDYKDKKSPNNLVVRFLKSDKTTPIFELKDFRGNKGELVFNGKNQAVFIRPDQYGKVTWPGGKKGKLKFYTADFKCKGCDELKEYLKNNFGLVEKDDYDLIVGRVPPGVDSYPHITDQNGKNGFSGFNPNNPNSIQNINNLNAINNELNKNVEKERIEFFSSRLNFNVPPSQIPSQGVSPGFGGVQQGGGNNPLSSSVRLRIQSGKSIFSGSGTVIGSDNKYQYILTVGHAF